MVKFADKAERVISERYIANGFYCYAKSAKVTIFISRFSVYCSTEVNHDDEFIEFNESYSPA